METSGRSGRGSTAAILEYQSADKSNRTAPNKIAEAALGVYRLNDGCDFDDERRGRVHWSDNMGTLDRAILNVQNARQIAGKPYAGKILTQDFPTLRREINKEFTKLSGHRLEHSIIKITDFEIQDRYESVRKGHYKVRKRGLAVMSDRPLFGETEGASLIYAHTARIPKYPSVLVVKLGITRSPLREYLAKKRIYCDPKLLAYTSGDDVDEKRYKAMWRQRGRVADGNEWLWPEPDVFEWLIETFDHIEPLFHVLRSEAAESLAEYRRKLGMALYQ